MTDWKRKRFWKEARVAEAANGYAVSLDGRAIKTPAKAPLVLPTVAMANAVADEWNAQGDQIDPRLMPVTRSANSAIDKVMPQRHEVAMLVAAYGETDLLCYRADGPEGLIACQAEGWDPLLRRAAEELQTPLLVTTGIIHQTQPADSLARLAARVAAHDAFELTALHDLVALSGSLIIGIAAVEGWAPADALWHLSRIDETWQEEQWGADEDATALAESKHRDFLHAMRFYALTHGSAQAA
ncbi:ATP12 family chaperone protein [Actibacterium sp. D379-3]